jgi:digeranylgeranylglycerophospholipid reductase
MVAGTARLFLARGFGKFKRKILVLARKKDLLEFSFNTLGSFLTSKNFVYHLMLLLKI